MASVRQSRNLNWDYIESVINEVGKSLKGISIELGRSKSYLSMAKQNDSIDDAVLRLFCMMYNADYERATHKDAPKPADMPSEVANVLADLLVKVGELNTQMETIKARLDRPADPTDFNILSNKEKATVILKAMQYENGAVDTIDYENKLKEFNVPYECIKQAMAATSSQFITKQYGNKKIKWIVVI